MLKRREFLKLMAALGLGTLADWRVSQAVTGQAFTIPPTLQHVGEREANLYFRLNAPTHNGLVSLSQAGKGVQSLPFSTQDSLRIQLPLTGLEPASSYEILVTVDGQELNYLDDPLAWSRLSFKTQPYPFPLRMAAIGDSGFGHETTSRLGAMMAAEQPDVFFHLGDVVYWMHQYDNDAFVNWAQKYYLPFRGLLKRVPHYPTFGNHDMDAPTVLDGWYSYFWMFPPFNNDQWKGGRWWYSFDLNGIQFLSLNSQLFYAHAEIRGQQEAWLDEKLARQDVLYTVVFCHIPPYTSSAPHQWDGLALAEQWVPKFKAAGVPLVISGHAHIYERLKDENLNLIIAGCGSDTLYGEGQRLDYTQNLWRIPAYPLFEFYPDRIHLRVTGLEGQVLDDLDLTWA